MLLIQSSPVTVLSMIEERRKIDVKGNISIRKFCEHKTRDYVHVGVLTTYSLKLAGRRLLSLVLWFVCFGDLVI